MGPRPLLRWTAPIFSGRSTPQMVVLLGEWECSGVALVTLFKKQAELPITGGLLGLDLEFVDQP